MITRTPAEQADINVFQAADARLIESVKRESGAEEIEIARRAWVIAACRVEEARIERAFAERSKGKPWNGFGPGQRESIAADMDRRADAVIRRAEAHRDFAREMAMPTIREALERIAESSALSRNN